MATFRLLTTGNIPSAALESYAETLLVSEPSVIQAADILERFGSAFVRTSPYAYALDVSGETTIDLIEADPVSKNVAQTILDDGTWISLQGICGE